MVGIFFSLFSNHWKNWYAATRMADASSRNCSAALVYGSALLQGMGMVSFPASSAVLRASKGLTDAQYGTIFLPLVVTTIAASLAGGALSRRVRLKGLLAVALVFNILSQAALALAMSLPAAHTLHALLAATALFGIAFGLSAGPLNAFPTMIFPARRDAALLALHTVIGTGLAAGPFLAGWLISHQASPWLPRVLIVYATALLVAVAFAPLRFTPMPDPKTPAPGGDPLRSPVLWTCIALAVLYALAEGTLANWAVLYLAEDRGVAPSTAAYALATFWAMFATGRLVLAALLVRVQLVRLWLASPVLMAVAFVALPSVKSAETGIALFGFAGFACAGFFPMTISLVSGCFPGRTALVSSLMTAGLMAGVGAGSYVVGPLRGCFSMEQLYVFSALYPLLAFAVGVVLHTSGQLNTPQNKA